MGNVRTYSVDGMTCEGCVRAVTNAIRKAGPDAFVQIDLPTGTVSVGGIDSDDTVRTAVEQAGFDFLGPVNPV
ncbi:MAG: heavy-metal-associated domain-containing protein [Rhodospirillales bacterium]|nr:heavy-metal-associated domain-containing protein [Rhodospirillales bacterium]